MLRVPERIQPYGFTGSSTATTNEEHERDSRRVYEITAELHAKEGGEPYEIFTRVLAAVAIADYQNNLGPLVTAYNNTARAARAAVQSAENAYAELAQRTTTAWHAAHHRYIAAAVAARTTLDAKAEARAHLVSYQEEKYRPGLIASFYDQVVPASQRIDIAALTELTETPDVELDLFTEQQRERMQLLAHTLTGSTPAGFEPEPAPIPEPEKLPATSAYGNR